MMAPSGFERSPDDRYLLPREHRLATIRQHPAMLVPPLAAAFGGVLAATAVSVVSSHSRLPQVIAWVLALLLTGRCVVVVGSWGTRRMVMTGDRFMLVSGTFGRRVKLIPYSALLEMTYSRSFAGRLLGFGTFTIEAGGRPVLVIDYIPYPEQLQLLLSGQSLPHSRSDGDDFDPAEPD